MTPSKEGSRHFLNLQACIFEAERLITESNDFSVVGAFAPLPLDGLNDPEFKILPYSQHAEAGC